MDDAGTVSGGACVAPEAACVGYGLVGERDGDGDEEKMAGGEPALSQGLVEELAGCRPALPARAARHAAVAGPTHARRGAARACCTATADVASYGASVVARLASGREVQRTRGVR